MGIITKVTKKYKLKYTRFLLLYLALAGISAFINVLITRIASSMSDLALTNDLSKLTNTLLLLAEFTTIAVFSSFLSTLIKERQNAKYAYKIRGSYISYLLSISLKNSSKLKQGETLSLYSKDLTSIPLLLAGELLTLLSGLFSVIFSLYYMFSLNLFLTIFYLATFPICTLIQMKLATPIQGAVIKQNEERGKYNNVVSDSLENTSLILSYGLEEIVQKRYFEKFEEYSKAAHIRFKIFASLIIKGMIVTHIPMFIVLGVCGYQAYKGSLSFGEFLTFTTLASTAQEWITMLSQHFNQFQQHKGGTKRFLDSLIYEEESINEENYDTNDPNAIEINNLSFSYDGESDVLKNVNLSIKKGETIAIVGKSGCGKSTMAKLMLGIEHPQKGFIKYFNKKNENTTSLFSLISYVPQDCFLLSTSIKENIISSDKNINLEKLKNSIRIANIDNFISSLSNKVDYLLTDGGENISGGQKQRIAIARAIYNEKPILLLDEATSALDSNNERIVMENIMKIDRGLTRIIITHRLSNIKNADCIYLFDNGEIIEKGTYSELLEKNGLFTNLVKTQQLEDVYEKAENL